MARTKAFDPDGAVDRAVEVFWRQGFAGTTPQNLVDALGIGKGSLYNAFGSKHGLFTLALSRYADEQAAGLVEFLAQAGPVRPKLRQAMQIIVEMSFGDASRRGCLAVNTAAEVGRADDEINVHVQRMFDRTEAAFQGALVEARRTGEIAGTVDPAATASLLLTTLIGIQVLAKSAPDQSRIERAIDALLAGL
jgi:TetR/AcrR family transcriptional regulator, transcriptional repressor for nem operon